MIDIGIKTKTTTTTTSTIVIITMQHEYIFIYQYHHRTDYKHLRNLMESKTFLRQVNAIAINNPSNIFIA